jgi:replicative DNA helicase
MTISLSPNQFSLGEGFDRKVLALCLRDPIFFQSHVDVIKPHYFENSDISTLIFLISQYYSEHFIIPTHEAINAQVYEHGKKYGGQRVDDLIKRLLYWVDSSYIADLSDSQYITDKMVAFGQQAAIKKALDDSITIVEKGDPNDIGKLRQIFDDALRVGSTRDTGTFFGEVAPNLSEIMLNDPVYGIKNKVPTGFSLIDTALMGGLGVGEVMVIAGRTSIGKSTIMVNIAKHAAYHFKSINSTKSVIYFTLEGGMKELDIHIKLAASMTGVSINEILSGKPEYKEKIQEHLRYIGNRSIKVKYFPPSTIDTEQLRWNIANMISIDGIEPGLIIVDYADKFKGMDENMYLQAGKIYDSLTAMGDRFKCPFITGSQINKEWSHQDISDVRGLDKSYLKSANADVVITLNQTEEEFKAGLMRLFLAKVRKGESHGIVYCHYSGPYSCVWQCSTSEIQQLEEASKKRSGGSSR